MHGINARRFLGALASASLALAASQGDTQCTEVMCVSANVNPNNTVTYVLQSTGMAELGWMAIGFGTKMAGSPMVILWPNDDMSITLSQRMAPMEVMPTLDPNPPRVATLDMDASDVYDCMNPKLSFTIPANSDTNQNLIWAFSNATVSDPSPGATIMGHIAMGTYVVNLQGNAASLNPVDQLSASSSMSASTTPTSGNAASSPSKTGAATSLKSSGKNMFIGGALSLAAFLPFF